MSSPNVSSLSAGVQQLYNQGLLSNGLSTGALQSATTGQLNQLATSSIAGQETATLLGLNSDTSALSSTATNYLTASTAANTTTDALTAAVDASILAPGTTAANQYLPQAVTNGSKINVLG
jgi:hypothetical protein